jgi:hypothetical protein
MLGEIQRKQMQEQLESVFANVGLDHEELSAMAVTLGLESPAPDCVSCEQVMVFVATIERDVSSLGETEIYDEYQCQKCHRIERY